MDWRLSAVCPSLLWPTPCCRPRCAPRDPQAVRRHSQLLLHRWIHGQQQFQDGVQRSGSVGRTWWHGGPSLHRKLLPTPSWGFPRDFRFSQQTQIFQQHWSELQMWRGFHAKYHRHASMLVRRDVGAFAVWDWLCASEVLQTREHRSRVCERNQLQLWSSGGVQLWGRVPDSRGEEEDLQG